MALDDTHILQLCTTCDQQDAYACPPELSCTETAVEIPRASVIIEAMLKADAA